jgi:hypothetical protein
MKYVIKIIMTQAGGDFLPGPETVNLPPMLFDGEEMPMVEALARLVPAYSGELAAARAVEADYQSRGPGGMDVLAWLQAKPKAVRAVERTWSLRLSIVDTGNFTERALTPVLPSEIDGIPGREIAEPFLDRLHFSVHGPQLLAACTTARELYHLSLQEPGPGADEAVVVRRWIHDIYMTVLLRRFILMKATDSQILAMTGGKSLDDDLLEFISQVRAGI